MGGFGVDSHLSQGSGQANVLWAKRSHPSADRHCGWAWGAGGPQAAECGGSRAPEQHRRTRAWFLGVCENSFIGWTPDWAPGLNLESVVRLYHLGVLVSTASGALCE